MIAVKDLRVGNSLYDFNGKLVEVLSLKENNIRCVYKRIDTNTNHVSLYHNEELSPISLNAKILEKCGFEKLNRIDNRERKPCYAKFSFALMLRHDSYFIDWIGGNTEIKYLHDLQNLYWCLCKKELVINLQ